MELSPLDQTAWDRWVQYRKLIRKPIKSASEDAMKLRLQRYGADQAAVVDQSISMGYQGLFELKKSKPAFGERPVKTDKQIAADNEHFAWMTRNNEKYWNSLQPSPINKLKLCEALWARYTIEQDSFTEERMAWLKDVTKQHLKAASARDVLGEPSLMSMVWCLFGQKGAEWVRNRAQ